MAKPMPPAVGINPSIPVPIQRDLRTVAYYAFSAHSQSSDALAALPGKVSKTPADLDQVAQYVSSAVQANGKYPINLTALPGQPAAPLAAVGPGAGTYTVGAKITSGGTPGTITIDQYGRVTAIQQAT
jgi:hypothetical protein